MRKIINDFFTKQLCDSWKGKLHVIFRLQLSYKSWFYPTRFLLILAVSLIDLATAGYF